MKYKILITGALVMNAYFMQFCNDAGKTGSTATETDSSMKHNMPSDSMNSTMMNSDGGMMQPMNTMVNKMHAMEISGDFDLDFANMMIIHHQAAIDMCGAEFAKGSDAKMKTMSENIVTAQKTEINQLERFAKNYKMPKGNKVNEEMHNKLSETMNAMMDKMKNMQMTGNTDKDFARMMITHHESAVKMAKDEISHGKRNELKAMAQKMINDQSKEISDFNSWLSIQK